MILADTSVWIEHLRGDLPDFRAALADGAVAVHPFVVGELACGQLKQRTAILGHIQQLPELPVAQHVEVLDMVDRWKLAGSGVGWIDAHLLASARIAGARLWTFDTHLAAAWQRMSLRLA